MKRFILPLNTIFGASSATIAMMLAAPAHAQTSPTLVQALPEAVADVAGGDAAPQTSDKRVNGTSADDLGDIVVTAQRRSEALQSVPVAISAFRSVDRERIGLRSAQDLINFTPGASLSQVGLSIRGIGRFTTVLGSDPGVAIYTDGFYSADPGLIGQDTLFVERVEILRGPQGTLFGRNSIGGSANIISRRPSSQSGGEFRVSAGNYGTFNVGGTFTGPITDTVRFRIAGQKSIRREGFIENIAPGAKDLQDLNSLYVEGQLEWDVTPSLQAWVKYSHSEADNTPGPLTSPVLTTPYFSSTFFPAASLVPAGGYDTQTANPGVNDIHTVNEDDPGRATQRGEHRIVGSLTWDVGSVTLKYLGGFETGSTFAEGDYDTSARASYVVRAGGPDPAQPAVGTVVSSRYLYATGQDTKYTSHELTVGSGGKRFTWIAGGNYYNENLTQPYALRAPDIAQLAQPIYGTPPFAAAAPNPSRAFYSQLGTLKTTSTGAFAQADYSLTDQFQITAGARYTRDHKIGTENVRLVFFNPIVANAAFESSPAVSSRRIVDTWSGLTARLALNWKPDADTLGYASYSRGYKSGGFQLGQIATTAEVAPEHVNAFELGLKKTLGRLRINTAVFYNDYSNYQVPITVLRGSGTAGAITQSQFVNAKSARIFGVEIEAIWRPSAAIQFIANYSYLNGKSTDFKDVFDITNPTAGNQDLSGNDLPQAPRHKASVGASYAFPLKMGSLTFAATNSYVGQQYYSPFSIQRYRGGAYNVTNLTATLYDTENGIELSAYARNVFNADYIYGLSLGAASVNSPRSVSPGDPRTYGVEARFKF